MSFLKWVRGGKEEPTPSLNKITIESAISELMRTGEVSRLASAFVWSQTPQGYGYWDWRCRGREAMSVEDWQFCQEALDVWERRQNVLS